MRSIASTAAAVAVLVTFTVAHFYLLLYTLRFLLSRTLGDDAHTSNVPQRAPTRRIYVYDIPERLLHRDYQMDLESCPDSFYSVEIELPRLLKQSKWSLNATHTKDAALADYFLVPHYSTCYYNKCMQSARAGGGQNCEERVKQYMSDILDHVEAEYPFWQRNAGMDHMFVLSWDWGVHLFGDQDESVIRNRLASSIHLTLLGLAAKDKRNVFDPQKDLSIPPLRDYRIPQSLQQLHRERERAIFAYFRGTITDEFRYSRGLRQRIRKYGEDDPVNYFVRLQHGDFYWHELSSARYALCPAGWSHWSPRLFDAILAGALPVLIADEWVPAFNGTFVNYDEFIVRVAEKDINNLTAILHAIPRQKEDAMRRNMRQYTKRFLYGHTPTDDDATDTIMQALARRPVPQMIPVITDMGGNSEAEYSPHDEEPPSRQPSEDVSEGEL